MSFRKPSPRTLLVVDLATRKVAYSRDENMNGNPGAKITKPIYELVKSGKGIMFYAHTPHLLRVPVEINGRFYAKPTGWTPKVKVVAPVAPIATAPKVRKFYNLCGFHDGTAHVEWDDTNMICVGKDGSRKPAFNWNLAFVNDAVKRGTLQEA